jgi:hypothetical protein
MKQRRAPRGEARGPHKSPAITYSRAIRTTIGPGCLTAVFGMGTGVAIRVCSPGKRSDAGPGGPAPFVYKLVAVRLFSRAWARQVGPRRRAVTAEERINAVKRLAVSTGQLRPLLALHTRPIDLVVYQEPSVLRHGDLILEWVSRLDAFSVYPGRT